MKARFGSWTNAELIAEVYRNPAVIWPSDFVNVLGTRLEAAVKQLEDASGPDDLLAANTRLHEDPAAVKAERDGWRRKYQAAKSALSIGYDAAFAFLRRDTRGEI